MKDQLIYFKRIVPMPSIPQSHSLNLISWESEIIMLTSQGLLWLYKIIQKIRMRLNMSLTHKISAAFIMKGASTFPTQQLHSPKKSSWKKFGVKSEKTPFCMWDFNSTEENGSNRNKWKYLLLYGLQFHTFSSTSGQWE